MIAIIDYGLGNIGSIYNMLKKVGCEDVFFASKKEDLHKADKYILPGVGAFDTGMNMLNSSGMREELDKQVLSNGKKILGICLGMQMLGLRSEEGTEPGLGYIPFECIRFNLQEKQLSVPHMGWDYIEISKNDNLLKNPREKLRFYFVHSFYALCENDENVLARTDYGVKFASMVCERNIYGVQFHPEKSHSYGKWLFGNFVKEV